MLLDNERYNIRKQGSKSRKWSSVWTHFKVISGENSVICRHCKRKLKYATSGSTTPLLIHLRRRHPSVVPLSTSRKNKPRSPRNVCQLEETSNVNELRKQPGQLLIQVEKMQRRLNEKDAEVTETYKTLQQTIQALKDTMQVMKEQLRQPMGKHQVADQSEPGSLFQTSNQELTAASSQHASQLSPEHTEEKTPGSVEDEHHEDCNGKNDDVLDYNPHIDLKYLLQDDSDPGENPENQTLQSPDNDCNTVSSTDPEARELYSCTWCGDRFTKEYYMKLHRLIHDKEATVAQCLSEPMKYVKVMRPYKCGVCGAGLNTFNALHVHLRLHNPENGHCERDERGRRLYKCGWCDKTFTDSTFFCVHQGVHLGEKVFVCSWCKKSFTYPTSLRSHQNWFCKNRPTQNPSCNPQRSYLCDFCGKEFGTKNHFQRHAMLHTGERPYKCEVCDKGFRMKCSLTQHSLSHAKERPFKCQICGKGFTRLYFVQKHQRVHTKEKPYSCSYCGKVFGYQESLYVHKKRCPAVAGC